jgi:signal transduction histidine kinase
MRFGLRAKFILLISLVLLIVIGAAAYFLLTQNVSSLRRGILADLQSFTSLATKPIGDTFILYRDGGQIKVQEAVQHYTDLNKRISNITISNIDGNTVFSSDNKINAITADQASSFTPLYLTASDGTLQRVIAPYIEDNGAHRYTLAYDVSNADVVESIKHIVQLVIMLSFGGLLVSALLTYLLIKKLFLDPLSQVRTGAQAITNGQLDQQITVSRHDEVGDLAKAVNTMADFLKNDIKKLKELDNLKSEFMMIASHNLRTPLSIMEGYLDILSSEQKNPESVKHLMKAQTQLKVLAQFSEDMITISSIEVGQTISQLEEGDLNKLVAETYQNFKEQAETKGLKYTLQLPTNEIRLLLSPRYLSIAIGNIIENAIKFTSIGDIVINLGTHDTYAEISVTDTGIGIQPQEQAKLFTKFHRGTSTLNYDYEGMGVGLYLSKLILAEHGGTIKYEPRPAAGSCFIIQIPLLSSPAEQIPTTGKLVA